ncbi:hypothetical protein D3C71_1552930 [compost metagenome]
MFARQRVIGIHAGHQRGARGADGGVGLGQARLRRAHRRAVGQCFVHQRVELRVAVALPPLRVGPGGVVSGQSQLGRIQCYDGFGPGFHQCAAAQGKHQYGRKKAFHPDCLLKVVD